MFEPDSPAQLVHSSTTVPAQSRFGARTTNAEGARTKPAGNKDSRASRASRASRNGQNGQNGQDGRDGRDVVGDAVARAVAWVKACPETRVPLSVLAALYPAGGVVHAVGVDPVVMGGFAAPAAAVGFLAARGDGGPAWARFVAAGAAGVPGWLAWAAHAGVTDLRTLLGYSCGATAAWGGLVLSGLTSSRQTWRDAQQEWSEVAARIGLRGTVLRKSVPTRLGYQLFVDVRRSTRTATAVVRSDARERLAAELSLPLTRVGLRLQRTHAGMVVIDVRTCDPWVKALAHPLLDPGSEVTVTSPTSVTKPQPVGMDPNTGEPLNLAFYDEDGAIHMVIVAAQGGGKTTLLNCMVERLTACTDALVWAIDMTKGKDIKRWADALDWHAVGPEQASRALNILRAGKRTIELRAASSQDKVHKPTPDAPLIAIIIDEVSSLLARQDRIGEEARALAGFIATKGRSEAVELILAGQRGTLSHLGASDIKANSFTRIVLGVASQGEMQHIVPDYIDLALPDMSKYGEGHRGVALIVERGGTWRTGRTFNLSELSDVAALAAARTGRAVHLETSLAHTLGPAYTERAAIAARTNTTAPTGSTGPAASTGTGSTGSTGAGSTGSAGTGSETTGSSGVDRGEPVTTSESSSSTSPTSPTHRDVPALPFLRPPVPVQAVPVQFAQGVEPSIEAGSIRALPAATSIEDVEPGEDGNSFAGEVDRELEPIEPLSAVLSRAAQETASVVADLDRFAAAAAADGDDVARQRWLHRQHASDLADRAVQVPDRVRVPVLGFLEQRGHDGASRAELAELLELGPSQASEWLRVMRVQGLVGRRGSTKVARYMHPAFAASETSAA